MSLEGVLIGVALIGLVVSVLCLMACCLIVTAKRSDARAARRAGP